MKLTPIIANKTPFKALTQEVKSYFVWKANNDSPMKITNVIIIASSTIIVSNKLVTTPIEYPSNKVNAPSKIKFVGYSFDFHIAPSIAATDKIMEMNNKAGWFMVNSLTAALALITHPNIVVANN
ncbi:hypothetical protein WICPIJ_003133 [Wickerhamomyces pijperi]|uniref:Uncharacterized protein n=1 Tax=Wickerhamomyces pijperi TaxID=599730 RepID=A0A9P8TP59_WICPI|nr:hypothetical protein WICPIJ_003133 [Wickerhamomyces pijperi]